MDLGSGNAEVDDKWCSRSWVYKWRVNESAVRYPRGSICERFEGRKWEEFVFDGGLSEENERALRKWTPMAWPEGDVSGPGLGDSERFFVVEEGKLVPISDVHFEDWAVFW
jgi:hypothetical protein